MHRGEGANLYDINGRKYLDFLSAFSSVNQGHCNPKIRDTLVKQSERLTQTSFITASDQLGPVSKFFSDVFKFDKILFMNSGYEADDTAILLARKWGYQEKKIPKDKAKIIFAKHCFWGTMIAARSGSDEKSRKENFEPLATQNLLFDFVEFDDPQKLEEKFRNDPNIAAFIFEPIQGHAGNIHPKEGYYKKVRDLCNLYNVLMIADEVQSGLGRTGKLLCVDWEDVKPDIVTLGKSLAGGFMPVSAVLANDNVMKVWNYGDHSSTFSANPLGLALSKRSVEVLFEDKMIENSEKLGRIVAEEMRKWKEEFDFITEIQCGRGLFTSIKFKDPQTV